MDAQPGRNDPCPCNSGLKYKKCCQQRLEKESSAKAAQRQGVASELREALAHHQAGRLADAADGYARILALAPDHPDALNLLGVIACQSHDYALAVELCTRAAAIDPGNHLYQTNLGNALKGLGDVDRAMDRYHNAVSIAPNYADGHYNLAVAYQEKADFTPAQAHYRKVLNLDPNHAQAQNNLGVILKDQGKLAEAQTLYREAIRNKPDYADARNNLGVVLKALDRSDEAEVCFREAVSINPQYADAYNNLGNLLSDRGRWEDAMAAFRSAIAIDPQNADAYLNLGVTLHDRNALDEAEGCYRRAIELKPEFSDAHSNLGNTLLAQGKAEQALDSHRKALALDSKNAKIFSNLGVALEQGKLREAANAYRAALDLDPDFAEAHNNLGSVLQNLGRLPEALACFRRALEIKPDYLSAHSNLIFGLDLSPGFSAADLQAERKRWNERQLSACVPKQGYRNVADADRRIRVGYVSADFRFHSAASVFGSMLVAFDRSAFEVYAYSNTTKEDAVTECFKRELTGWRRIVGKSDEEVAAMIEADAIDILIDLSGHSAGGRLPVFARKPAPIQCTAWGYAAGTGMPAMDVFFSDPVVVPPEEKPLYPERVRYLPNMFGSFFFHPFPEVGQLPATATGQITFGSFNRIAKISEKTFDCWRRILLEVPGSRLLLKTPELDDEATREMVLERLTRDGVAADRVELLGRSGWTDHVANYNRVDIGLDPFPHGGGVTTIEALMMGVPVVTLKWETVAGRLSASILTTLAMTDWIARSETDYIELAVQAAGDRERLLSMRGSLRRRFNESIIGDAKAYMRAVEAEYRALWREWCARSGSVGSCAGESGWIEPDQR